MIQRYFDFKKVIDYFGSCVTIYLLLFIFLTLKSRILCKIHAGCVLQLRLGASLQSEWRSIRLFTEHPPPNWKPTPIRSSADDDSIEEEGSPQKPNTLRRSSKSSNTDLVGEDERAARRATFLSPIVPHKRLIQRPVYPLKFSNLHAPACASLLKNSPRNCNCFSWDTFDATADLRIHHAGSWLIFYTLDSRSVYSRFELSSN